MTEVKSKKIIINSSCEDLFIFISNLNNFKKLMPEQIVNWKSTNNTCSFTIKEMADIGMRIFETTPYSEIIIIPDGKVPFDFNIICYIKKNKNDNCSFQLILNAELNSMFEIIAKKPLANFVNILVQNLKKIKEKDTPVTLKI
jgi:hypothetical protein